jgi:hypothetical protein
MSNTNPANEVLHRLESDRTPIPDLGNEPLALDDVLAYVEEFRGDDSRDDCVVYPAFGPETFIFSRDKWKRPQRDPASNARTGDNIVNFWVEAATTYWYFGYEPEDSEATVPSQSFRWYLYGPIPMDSPDVDAVERTLDAQEYPVCSITDAPQTVRESVRA